MKRFNLDKGFTLVEMLVVAPIVILAIGAFITVVISMTGEVLTSRASNMLSFNVQDALNRVEQDVKLSTTFLAENNLTPQNGQGINNSTTKFANIGGTDGPALILNMIVTNGNPVTTTSGFVFLANQPAACNGNSGDDYNNYSRNVPMTYNVVYFVKDNSLWRRTIMPSNYTVANAKCGAESPWQRPSCTPGYNTTTYPFCQTEDIRLVDGVSASGFFVQYYTSADSANASAPASSGANVGDRNTALLATPTVGISINAQQTVAGRSIERSGTLRATRLETNASAIASQTAPPAPASPSVTARTATLAEISSVTAAPTDAIFSWPAVNYATTYNVQWRIGTSGAWSTAINQSERTFKATGALHTNTVQIQVKAVNSQGVESAIASSSIKIPRWTPMNLTNGWTNYPAPHSSAAYTKTASGMVVLKGLVRLGSGVIANLPPGYRISTNEFLLFANSSNQALGRLDVNSNGNISMNMGTNTWFGMDGISYMPTGPFPTGTSGQTNFTNLTGFQNGWTNYSPSSGDPNWAPAGYFQDSAGRITMRGLIRAGTVAGGTPMLSVPASVMPSEYNHMVQIGGNAITHVSLRPANNSLDAKGGNNAYIGMNMVYYPTGRSTGTDCTTQWCNLSLQSGWVHYGNPYTTPQYTKGPDGLVILKGLIRAGSGTTMATLPPAFCPKEQMLITTVAADAWGRVDVSPGSPTGALGSPGCIVFGSVYSTTWTSLDSLKFIADYQE